MNFITKRIHAFLDYPVAIILIVLPFILSLGQSNPIALYLSVSMGIVALLLAILTNHHSGVFKVISYENHLIIDFVIALVFIVSPFIFSFEGLDVYYYWTSGITFLTVVGLQKLEGEENVILA